MFPVITILSDTAGHTAASIHVQGHLHLRVIIPDVLTVFLTSPHSCSQNSSSTCMISQRLIIPNGLSRELHRLRPIGDLCVWKVSQSLRQPYILWLAEVLSLLVA